MNHKIFIYSISTNTITEEDYGLSNGFTGDVPQLLLNKTKTELFICGTTGIKRAKLPSMDLISTYSISIRSTPPTTFGSGLELTREGVQLNSLTNLEEGTYNHYN